MSNIMYRYAQAENLSAVAIEDIDAEDRKKHGTLTCFGCGREMIPAMGRKMEHHFRHKVSNEVPCGFETYLHRMTKIRVCEILRKFRDEDWDMILRERDKKTIIILDETGVEAFRETTANDISVLDGATSIELERKHEGVVPDILVSRGENGAVFFEIAVTHACEDAKIDLGIPIIELSVTTEEDADRIAEMLEQSFLEEDGEAIVSYNFPQAFEATVDHARATAHRKRLEDEAARRAAAEEAKLAAAREEERRAAEEEAANEAARRALAERYSALRPAFPGRAWTTEYTGILTRNGHVLVGDPDKISPRGAVLARKLDVPMEVNSLQALDAFSHFLQFEARKRPRTCLLCVRHSFAFIRRSESHEHKTIFCLKKKTACRPDEAGSCRSFYPLKSMDELLEHREKLAAKPRANDETRDMVPPDEGWFDVA